MKKLLFLSIILYASHVWAYDFEVDKIYYNVLSFDDMTCEVVGCNGIQTIIIPEIVSYNNHNLTVIGIGKNAFANSDIKDVTIPRSVKIYKTYGFFNCHLNTLHLEGLSEFCQIDFSGAYDNPLGLSETVYFDGKELQDLVIPEGVTKIGSYTFSGSKIQSLTIPNSVVSIGSGAFSHCNSLTSAIIPEGVSKLGYYVFNSCSNFEKISLPSTLKEMGGYIFTGGKLLECSVGCNNKFNQESSDNTLDSYVPKKNLKRIILQSSVSDFTGYNFGSVNNLDTLFVMGSNPPKLSSTAFSNSQIMDLIVIVPKGHLTTFKKADVWKELWNIKECDDGGTEVEPRKCAKPTINYSYGKLSFCCDTEGAEYHSTITDLDIASYNTNEVQLDVTYNISVYATKSGYGNSDVATATLCWIDKEPTITDISNAAELAATPVLIQSNGGTVTIQGADDGTQVSIYNTAGQMAGSTVSSNGHATVFTNLEPGTIAIVKIGTKSVKVVVK